MKEIKNIKNKVVKLGGPGSGPREGDTRGSYNTKGSSKKDKDNKPESRTEYIKRKSEYEIRNQKEHDERRKSVESIPDTAYNEAHAARVKEYQNQKREEEDKTHFKNTLTGKTEVASTSAEAEHRARMDARLKAARDSREDSLGNATAPVDKLGNATAKTPKGNEKEYEGADALNRLYGHYGKIKKR